MTARERSHDLREWVPEELRDHPAPYPAELAERLIRMFSFVGDTVRDETTGLFSAVEIQVRKE
jgi:hypothetical protein